MKYYLFTALSGLLVSCAQNSIETSPIPPQIERAASTDIIDITRQGNPNGRTVILIPGLASSADVWTETAAALPDFDLRIVQVSGFAGAESFPIQGSYTDAIVGSIQAHLTDNPGKDTTIVGHSMGGFVGMKAAIANATPIKELVIVDSLPFLAGMFMPGTSPEQAAQSAPLMAKQMASMPRSAFDAQQAAGLARLAKTKAFHANLEGWSRASDQTTVATSMGEILATDLRPELSKVDAEITVLAAYDAAMGIPMSQLKGLYEAQYNLAPNHDVIVVEDSFHFIMIDQADKFKSLLRTALDD